MRDYGQTHETELSSIIIRLDIVLRDQLSSELASIACGIFNVTIIIEGMILFLLNIPYLHNNSEESHFSETYNYVSHNNRGKLLLLLENELGYLGRYRDGLPARRPGFDSLFHIVQTGSGAHPASYPMGTVGLFPQRQ
jgi:hypothetical protein